MDPVSQFQSGIPQNVEDLLDQLFNVVTGDILVDDHQIDIGVDTELFTSVASQCDQCDRYGVLQRQIVAEHGSERYFVDQLEQHIDPSGMFDQKVFPTCGGECLLQCPEVGFDIFFQYFCDLKISGILIQ